MRKQIAVFAAAVMLTACSSADSSAPASSLQEEQGTTTAIEESSEPEGFESESSEPLPAEPVLNSNMSQALKAAADLPKYSNFDRMLREVAEYEPLPLGTDLEEYFSGSVRERENGRYMFVYGEYVLLMQLPDKQLAETQFSVAKYWAPLQGYPSVLIRRISKDGADLTVTDRTKEEIDSILGITGADIDKGIVDYEEDQTPAEIRRYTGADKNSLVSDYDKMLYDVANYVHSTDGKDSKAVEACFSGELVYSDIGFSAEYHFVYGGYMLIFECDPNSTHVFYACSKDDTEAVRKAMLSYTTENGSNQFPVPDYSEAELEKLLGIKASADSDGETYDDNEPTAGYLPKLISEALAKDKPDQLDMLLRDTANFDTSISIYYIDKMCDHFSAKCADVSNFFVYTFVYGDYVLVIRPLNYPYKPGESGDDNILQFSILSADDPDKSVVIRELDGSGADLKVNDDTKEMITEKLK